MAISPVPSEPRPLRADAERNRRRLLAAAEELFAERGLCVGLEEVARHAGVGVGTAYRRFRDKDELIDALFEAHIDAIVALADRAAVEPDPWEGLVLFLRGAVEQQIRNRGLKEMLFGAGHSDERVQRARARLLPRTEGLLRRAQAAGAVRADLEVSDLPMLQFLVSGLAAFGPQASELWPRYLGIVLDGLRTPDAAPLAPPALDADGFETLLRGSGSGS